jgi:hypothetical protein
MPNGTQGTTADPQGRPQNTPANSPASGGATPAQSADKTYTQAEYSKMQSSLRKQIQELNDTLAEKETEFADVKKQNAKLTAENEVLQAEVDSPYSDEPTKSAAAKIREAKLAIAKDKADFAETQAKADALFAEVNAQRKEKYAQGLADKYGVDVKELLAFESEHEIDKYILANYDPARGAVQAPQTADRQRLPNAPSPATGPEGDWRTMSPSDKIKAGLRELPVK